MMFFKNRLIAVILGIFILASFGLACTDSSKTVDATPEQSDNSVKYLPNGYLTPESVETLRTEQFLIKAVTAYELAIPIVGVERWHQGFLTEAEHGDWVFYDNLSQKVPILTANQTTPYTVSYVDLAISPYYIEIPAGRIGGLVLDIYQRPQADLGILGPDKGKGGKYLLVGPGQEVPEGHDAQWVIKSNCNLVFLGTRIIGADEETTARLRKQHFVYKVGSTKEGQKFISASESPEWVNAQSTGLQYWEDLHAVLKNEPVVDVNRMILTLVRDLGISKSKGFKPNDEQKEILTKAAIKGDAIAMVNTFSKRSYKYRHWPDRQWRYILNQKHLDLIHPDYYEAKEIGSYTYEAFSTSKGMVLPTRNQGSKYLGCYVDGNGDWLDGSSTYELIVPPNPPAKDFWSIAVYNNKSRNLVDNETRNAIVNNKGNIKTEADGSVKVYIGPEAPAGYESNWVQSIKGEGFFTYLRLYGPTEAYFDKSWKMPDFKRVK
jgi:hypothetical protein